MSLATSRMVPMANAIRALSMDAVQAANSGHPGMPMGMADVATVLWSEYLKHDPKAPGWADRDRFVLSAGHGSMLIYSLLHLSGYERPTMEDIRNFRQIGSPCAGHPENFLLDGVESTTGPLGQGLAMSVGMAMAERHLNATFGDEIVDHRTWVIAGDGCLMEGINHEAIGLAGHLKLGRLTVFWDDNNITIDGTTDLSTSENIKARYEATGWHVVSCDGHDFDDIRRAIDEAVADERPSLIACKTVIGKGAPNKQGTSATHGAPLGDDEITAARGVLGWESAPFEIPEEVLSDWRGTADDGARAHSEWQMRLDGYAQKAEFQRRMAGELPKDFSLDKYIKGLIDQPQKVATRKASEMALAEINTGLPETIGGSADLTGSNNTKAGGIGPFTADDYSGRYVYYGIREFGMAAAMNGMALHGGVIPYGGTFLVFTDYCRAAIRLSALQQARVVYVMTHDSIGLGEDGPTHQPIEQLASMRAIPGFAVFRPADANETRECWIAMMKFAGPAVIATTRQNVPTYDRSEYAAAAETHKGAYVLSPAKGGDAQVRLVASGSEVAIAMDAQAKLAEAGVRAAVISVPCWELLEAQDAAYQDEVFPRDGKYVLIEAGCRQGWERWVGRDAAFLTLEDFGASAPFEVLYEKFGLTAEHAVRAAKKLVG